MIPLLIYGVLVLCSGIACSAVQCSAVQYFAIITKIPKSAVKIMLTMAGNHQTAVKFQYQPYAYLGT